MEKTKILNELVLEISKININLQQLNNKIQNIQQLILEVMQDFSLEEILLNESIFNKYKGNKLLNSNDTSDIIDKLLNSEELFKKSNSNDIIPSKIKPKTKSKPKKSNTNNITSNKIKERTIPKSKISNTNNNLLNNVVTKSISKTKTDNTNNIPSNNVVTKSRSKPNNANSLMIRQNNSLEQYLDVNKYADIFQNICRFEELTRDHIWPSSKTNDSNLDNDLNILKICKTSNQKKSSKTSKILINNIELSIIRSINKQNKEVYGQYKIKKTNKIEENGYYKFLKDNNLIKSEKVEGKNKNEFIYINIESEKQRQKEFETNINR